MTVLNKAWVTEKKPTTALVEEIFSGVRATSDIFGEHAGRKYKDASYERSLNRALFEVQAYYLSFAEARKPAVKQAAKVRSGFEKLSGDPAFVNSIEATTKSIENYRIRFDKFRGMLEKNLGIKLEPLRFSAS